MEHLRVLFYPMGFLASLFFGMRFYIQWLKSEKAQKSHVTKVFWNLSLAGNGMMALHCFLQLQYPLALIQVLNGIIAIRNLDLLEKKKLSFGKTLFLMGCGTLLLTSTFLFQQVLSNDFSWMRNATFSGTTHKVSLFFHILGMCGITLFASRFWIQWIDAERAKKSHLSRLFWQASIVGAVLSLIYFVRLLDIVNILAYGTGFVPYLRNLALLKREKKELKKGTLFLFSGEQSGDHLGANLAKELSSKGMTLFGVCGKKMLEAGVQPILPQEKFQVMGFSAVLKASFRLFFAFRFVKKWILRERPEAVILIDYPDFNMLLARALKKSGYQGKIIHYVSPSVWAWRKKRVFALEKRVDLLLTIFPFEKKYYEKTKLPVSYVGHPLMKEIAEHKMVASWKEEFSIDNKKIISIFPGSRLHEIKENLSYQLETALLLLKKSDAFTFVISCASNKLKEEILKVCKEKNVSFPLVPGEYRYEQMLESYASIATSGTITLELAIHKVPTVVTYKVSFLNYLIGKFLFRIDLPHYCIVNIIAGKTIFPEVIAREVTGKMVIEKLETLIEGHQELLKECESVCQELQGDASSQAAQEVLYAL